MSTQIKHNGGLVDAVLEVGFDNVKYFEGTISGTASGFTITPPARRLIVLNAGTVDSVFLRINDSPATTVVSFTPGDDIKIRPGGLFTMDFDTLTEISLVASGTTTVEIEGIIGFKATTSC